MEFRKRSNKWWLLFVTTSATSLVMLENTILPVALPTMHREINLSEVGLLWVINSYLLALSALLLVGGRLSDLFGKKITFMWGLVLFGLGSVLAALSSSAWPLMLGRILQGAGGALSVPATGALLIEAFPDGQRAKAIGINSGISSIFLILGPAVGGFLTEYVSWRGIFWINIPLVIFGLVMGQIILAKGKKIKEPFHFTGSFVMLFAVSTLVVALMEANSWGWSSPLTLGLLIASPFLFALFVWISLSVDHPLIDFRFFKKKKFTAANISFFISQAIISVTVLWAIFFQQELGFTAAKAGLLIFIATLPVFFMAPVGGFFSDRFGPRYPLLAGYVILFFSLVWLHYTVKLDLVWLLPGLLAFGCGLPMILSPSFVLALSDVPAEKLGSASGICTETRQLASTIGIAIMTALYQGVIKKGGSEPQAFSSTSLFAAALAFFGFWVVFFLVKKVKPHSWH